METSHSLRSGWGAGGWSALLLLVLLNAGTAALFVTGTGSGTDAAWTGVPIDDTWIHFVYARNLAEHGGLQFNPGEPEAGCTSPLWALLLGLCHLVLSPLGVGLVAIGKGLGVLLAGVVSLLACLVVRQLGGNRSAGILAGTLVALDPTFAFAKVSGMEVPLFAGSMLLVVLCFLRGRRAWTGVALGLTILTRPEGLVVAMTVGLALGLRLAWDGLRRKEPDLSGPAAVLLPAVLLVLPLALHHQGINGTPFPNTYLVKREFMGGGGPQYLGAVWHGYLAQLDWFAGSAALVSIPLLCLGAAAALARAGLRALPLILAPVGLWAGIAMTLSLAPVAWNFYTRRYLDGTIPLLAVLVVLGIASLHRVLAPRIGVPWGRRALAATLAAVCLALPAARGLGLWRELPVEFSWNCRNIEEVNVRMAHWVRDNLPSDALLAVGDAGAMRFFAPNPMFDLVGLNTHEAIGVDDFTFMARHRADYAVVFAGPTYEGWPHGRRIHEVRTGHNTILGHDEMVVYEIDWTPDLADATRCHGVDTAGWRPVGRLDVGKAADEARFAYEVTGSRGTFSRDFKAAAGVVIRDEGQVHTGVESMRIPTRPGSDLVVVKRYDAAVRGEVEVMVDGEAAGRWRFAPRPYQFGEDAFVVPASFIGRDTTRLEFRFVAGSAADINSFHYWFYER